MLEGGALVCWAIFITCTTFLVILNQRIFRSEVGCKMISYAKVAGYLEQQPQIGRYLKIYSYIYYKSCGQKYIFFNFISVMRVYL